MIQCRDGTQDQRNINAILELAAGVDGEAAKKVGEAAKEGEEGPSPKKRRREVKNAVRGSGQYVYDEDGVRLVSQPNPFNLMNESSQIPGLCCQCFSCWPFTSETSSGICFSFHLCIRVSDLYIISRCLGFQAYNDSHLHPLHWAGGSVDGRRGGTAR